MSPDSPTTTTPSIRADARRNKELIREAALKVFRDGGLTSPLEDVARAAGVSKGTIYHRFGGRQGLIDAVVEDLVEERINHIMESARSTANPGLRLETYLHALWMLQYNEPAANDVMLRSAPGSEQIQGLCERSSAFTAELLALAQRAGRIRDDIGIEDIANLIWERGVIVRNCADQPAAVYERSLTIILDGLRAPTADTAMFSPPQAR